MHARFAHAIASALLAVTSISVALRPAHAQTVGGEIVGLGSGKPVHGASVALVNDSAKIVSSTAADTASGMFYIDAPHAGHYRVVLFVPGGSFVSPPMQLDSGLTVERKFSVPEIPGDLRGAYFAQDVTTPARLVRYEPSPEYPRAERRRAGVAAVVAMFVVGENGRPDQKTFQVISNTPSDFAEAVRSSIGNVRYDPAVKDGRRVRQVVQLTVGFGVPGNTPAADVVVTSLDASRPGP